MRTVLLLALLVGCGSSRHMFVRSMAVKGREITVEYCPVAFVDDKVEASTECFRQVLHIPAPKQAVAGAPGAAP